MCSVYASVVVCCAVFMGVVTCMNVPFVSICDLCDRGIVCNVFHVVYVYKCVHFSCFMCISVVCVSCVCELCACIFGVCI